ncbi:hypothetical protein AKUG0402_12430 [Apilactobacillus kunkeei]|nr:hypothetical protein AKUG0402_12430 [Apilactobacillus kunkeei]
MKYSLNWDLDSILPGITCKELTDKLAVIGESIETFRKPSMTTNSITMTPNSQDFQNNRLLTKNSGGIIQASCHKR